MTKTLQPILLKTILVLACSQSFIKSDLQCAQNFDTDYPHQNQEFDESAGIDDDLDNEPAHEIKSYAMPIDDFEHMLVQKIRASKDHAITTVLEQVPNEPGQALIVVEHTISTLSLEKAQQLKDLYSNDFMIIKKNGLATYDLKSCQTTREHINHIKTVKKMTFAATGIFLTGSATLLCLFRNLLKTKVGLKDLLSAQPTRKGPRKVVCAWSTIGGTLLFGSLAGLATVLAWAAMQLEPSSIIVDLCDYKDKLIVTLDQRISELL
jgi:hypothetical protein